MKISIVVPSYNQGRFLEACLKSIIDQNYPELELFVYDGGSTDQSVEIIKRYSSHIFYWQSQQDGGQAAAIHAGFYRASGEILGWLNSDDMLVHGSLRKVADFFQQRPEVQVMYGDCAVIDGEGNIMKILREPYFYIPWQMYVRNSVAQSSCFFRRELYFGVDGLDTNLQCALDYDLWFKFAERTKIHHVPYVLSFQRQHAQTKTSRLAYLMKQEMDDVIRKYYGTIGPLRFRIGFMAFKAHRILVKLTHGLYTDFCFKSYDKKWS